MTIQININPTAAANGGSAIGLMTAAGNPWSVPDALAIDLVNRSVATYAVTPTATPDPTISGALATGLRQVWGSAPAAWLRTTVAAGIAWLIALFRGITAPSGCAISVVGYLHDTQVITCGATYNWGSIQSAQRDLYRFDKLAPYGRVKLTAASLQTWDGSTGALASSGTIGVVVEISATELRVVTAGGNTTNGVIYKVTTSNGWADSSGTTVTIVAYLGADNPAILAANTGETTQPNGYRALSQYSYAVNGNTHVFGEYIAPPAITGPTVTFTVSQAAGSTGATLSGAVTNGVYIMTMSNGNVRKVTVTGTTTAAWTTPLTGANATGGYAGGVSRVRLLKSTDGGNTWSVYWTMNGDATGATPLSIRHFHCAQFAPDGKLWVSTGDGAYPENLSSGGLAVMESGTIIIGATLPTLPDNTMLGSIAVTGVTVKPGRAWKTQGYLFKGDASSYRTFWATDADPDASYYQFAGIWSCALDGSGMRKLSSVGHNSGLYSGCIGVIDGAGRMAFSGFNNNVGGDAGVGNPVWTGQPDGASWAYAGSYGSTPASGAQALVYAFCADPVTNYVYYSCSNASGKGTASNYQTAIFQMQDAMHDRTDQFGQQRPTIVHPCYFTSATGTDDTDTASAGNAGQRGWSPLYTWATPEYATQGSRMTYGACLLPMGTNVTCGAQHTHAWNANANPGFSGAPVEIDGAMLSGYLRYPNAANWCVAGANTQRLRLSRLRVSFAESGAGSFFLNYSSASNSAAAHAVWPAVEMEQCAVGRLEPTGSAGTGAGLGNVMAIGNTGGAFANRCSFYNLAAVFYSNGATTVAVPVKARDCIGWRITSVVNSNGATSDATVVDFDYCTWQFTSNLVNFANGTWTNNSGQIQIDRSIIISNGTSTASVSHFGGTGWGTNPTVVFDPFRRCLLNQAVDAANITITNPARGAEANVVLVPAGSTSQNRPVAFPTDLWHGVGTDPQWIEPGAWRGPRFVVPAAAPASMQ